MHTLGQKDAQAAVHTAPYGKAAEAGKGKDSGFSIALPIFFSTMSLFWLEIAFSLGDNFDSERPEGPV